MRSLRTSIHLRYVAAIVVTAALMIWISVNEEGSRDAIPGQMAFWSVAITAGWLQMILALGALAEVARRAIMGSEPVESLMIGVALLALVANLTCVALLAKHRDGGVHLKASWIFSTNDALANLGVVFAGVLVAVTGHAWPDLAVGTAVGSAVGVGSTATASCSCSGSGSVAAVAAVAVGSATTTSDVKSALQPAATSVRAITADDSLIGRLPRSRRSAPTRPRPA